MREWKPSVFTDGGFPVFFRESDPRVRPMRFRSSVRVSLRVFGILAIVLFAVRPSWAWGPRAHRVATRVAYDRLTPAAREAIRELLHEGDTLVSIASWADEEGHDAVPGSAGWHFVNVPISAAKYDPKFCGAGGNCVVEKIKHYRKILADRNAPKQERTRALLFLVHFVEDVHNPMHVGDNHDRGGNNTQVQYYSDPTATNLHRVWDSQILEDASKNDNRWVESIAPLLTPENIAAWSKGDVETWADESLQEAKKAYQTPPGSPTSKPVIRGTRIGREYSEYALPVIRRRLAQAGVRLANELNEALGDESPASSKTKVKERTRPGVLVPAGRR